MDLVEWEPDDATSPTLAQALDCSYTITTGGNANWFGDATSAAYHDGDVATHPTVSNSQQTWMQTTVTAVAGDKASFYWKVSSETGDNLRFYIDDDLQDSISGEVDWQKKSYALTAGTRTLKWIYIKDASGGRYRHNVHRRHPAVPGRSVVGSFSRKGWPGPQHSQQRELTSIRGLYRWGIGPAGF